MLLYGTLLVTLLIFLGYTISLFDDPACEGGYCVMYFFTHSLPLVFLWLAMILGINLWLSRHWVGMVILGLGIPVDWMMVKADWVIDEGLTIPFKLLVALNFIFLILYLFRKGKQDIYHY